MKWTINRSYNERNTVSVNVKWKLDVFRSWLGQVIPGLCLALSFVMSQLDPRPRYE